MKHAHIVNIDHLSLRLLACILNLILTGVQMFAFKTWNILVRNKIFIWPNLVPGDTTEKKVCVAFQKPIIKGGDFLEEMGLNSPSYFLNYFLFLMKKCFVRKLHFI